MVMDTFDPAINYGPNDAGISAISIVLIIFGLIMGSWLIGAGYSLLTDLFKKATKNDWSYKPIKAAKGFSVKLKKQLL